MAQGRAGCPSVAILQVRRRTLSSDAVTGIQEQQADFGCQQGLSVYVANNTGLEAVTMKTLAVTKYQKDGIDCAHIGTTCTISGSTVTGIGPTGTTAQNGVEVDAGVTASITGGTIAGNSYTSPDYTTMGTVYTGSGILAYDTTNLTVSSNKVNHNDENIVGFNDGTGPAQGAWLISKNTVTAATNDTGAVPPGDSVDDGIDLYGTGGAGSATDVYGNTVTSNADWGITLRCARRHARRHRARRAQHRVPERGRRDLPRRVLRRAPELEQHRHQQPGEGQQGRRHPRRRS